DREEATGQQPLHLVGARGAVGRLSRQVELVGHGDPGIQVAVVQVQPRRGAAARPSDTASARRRSGGLVHPANQTNVEGQTAPRWLIPRPACASSARAGVVESTIYADSSTISSRPTSLAASVTSVGRRPFSMVSLVTTHFFT